MTGPGVALKRIVEDHPESTLADLVDGLCKAEGITRQTLAHQMGYDAKIFTRIGANENCSKKAVLALGIVLGFNLREIHVLLFFAGYALCPTNDIDRRYMDAIESFHGHGTRRLDNCNDYLIQQKIANKYLLMREKNYSPTSDK